MNIVANFIGHHVSQSTQKDSVKSEGDSLFASLFTKEISSTPKESLSEEDKLQKMIQRLREVLSSGNKKIEKDDMRVILPITLKDDSNSGIFAFSHTACVEQTTKEVTEDEPSMLVRDETMLHFLQTIEQMLSLGAHDEISDEALIHMTTTLEAFLQESENSLSAMNEADVMKQIQSLFSDVNVSTEELIKLAKALENLLHRIDSETSENHDLSLFISQMVETLEITLHAHDLGENVTSLTNHSPINIHSVHEGNGGKNQGVFMDDFQRISKEAQQLIEEILQNEQSSKANKQLLHLLEKAQSLKQTFNDIPTEELIEGSKDTKNIWMNLQSMYEKRSSLNKSGTYFHNAKVLSSDIGVWVERLTSENAASQAQPIMQVQQQMSPVEHFVLHTRTQDGQVVQQEQMMHQIQQIVQQSTIGKNQFFKQLSISIQPEQLGEMTIQLVKIDGEMIAKITVSSQATKSALESNLHQLKNMFAPHQVLIEKQDGEEQATFDQEDTSEEEHKPSHGNEKEQHAEDQPEHSFEEQFEQILAEAVGEP